MEKKYNISIQVNDNKSLQKIIQECDQTMLENLITYSNVDFNVDIYDLKTLVSINETVFELLMNKTNLKDEFKFKIISTLIFNHTRMVCWNSSYYLKGIKFDFTYNNNALIKKIIDEEKFCFANTLANISKDVEVSYNNNALLEHEIKTHDISHKFFYVGSTAHDILYHPKFKFTPSFNILYSLVKHKKYDKIHEMLQTTPGINLLERNKVLFNYLSAMSDKKTVKYFFAGLTDEYFKSIKDKLTPKQKIKLQKYFHLVNSDIKTFEKLFNI